MGDIIQFRSRLERETGFGAADQRAVSSWRDLALAHGFDRIDFHGAEKDGGERHGYVALYREEEPCPAVGIGRNGGEYVAWDCRTFADLGRFPDLDAAFGSLVLEGQGTWRTTPSCGRTGTRRRHH